eukprot:Selendium_serpulae@DN5364_c0_g1_i1.p1
MMVFYRMLLSLATVASVCWFFQSALLFTNSEERVSPRRLHDDASNKHADWEQLMRGSPSDLFAPVWIYPHISQGVSEYQLPAPQDAARCKQDDLAHLLVSKAGGGAAGAAPFFIDLAANRAVSGSNTYTLEMRGWTGLCVEANPAFWDELARLRSCAVVGAVMGADHDLQVMATDTTRGKEKGEQRFGVTTRTLLTEFAAPRVIDYAALGGEARAMKTFPFAEYRVNVMTMTRPSDEVVDLLIAHDYVPISLLSKDGETLWTHKAFALAPQEARGLAESVWRYAGRVDEAVAPRLATAFARLWPDMHGR